jgi:hypothetical protein
VQYTSTHWLVIGGSAYVSGNLYLPDLTLTEKCASAVYVINRLQELFVCIKSM